MGASSLAAVATRGLLPRLTLLLLLLETANCRLPTTNSLDGGANFTVTNTSINDALQRTFLPWAVADANGNFGVTWEVNEGGGAGVILYDTLDGTTLADGGNVTVTTVQITDFAEPTSKIPAQPVRGLFSVPTIDTDRSTGRLFLSYSDRPSTGER